MVIKATGAASNEYAKKAQAQKKAMKMWSDAAGAQQKIDRDLDKRASHIEDLRKEINELNKSVAQITDKQEELKEQYGITEADAQDLELLKKANSMEQFRMTDEEKAKAEQLKGERVGEYYERYAALEAGKGVFLKDMDDKQKELLAESKAITAIQNGRLKDHSMIDAQKKKEEERLEAIRDKNKENKDDDEEVLDIVDTDGILQLGDATKDIKQDVKKMVNEMNLLVEDLKGAAVDKEL